MLFEVESVNGKNRTAPRCIHAWVNFYPICPPLTRGERGQASPWAHSACRPQNSVAKLVAHPERQLLGASQVIDVPLGILHQGCDVVHIQHHFAGELGHQDR